MDIMRAWIIRAGIACLLVPGVSSRAGAQTIDGLPSGPIVFGDGVLTLGGDVSATIGSDDPGFFNYTDYENSELRMLRLELTAALRAGRHLSLLGEVRSQNAGRPRAYALYLRIRPWTERRFDVQVGRIPPTFGAFPRRSYEAENPLIGYPLAYQYLTSLRADAVPGSADELLDMRGRGWLASYTVGNSTAAPGVPIANALRWDTGVQAHAANDFVDFTGSITTGTLSNPLFTDDNSGRQVAGRVALHPVAGLILGASAAHGPFISREAARAAGVADEDRDFSQTAWGGDIEYSRGVLRASRRNGREPVDGPPVGFAGHRRAAQVRGHLRRRPLQDSSRLLRRRTRRSSGLPRNRRIRGAGRHGTRR